MTDLHAWPRIPPVPFRIRDVLMSSSINRCRPPTSATFVATAVVGVVEAAPRTRTPDWDSVDQHPPAPNPGSGTKQWSYGSGTSLLWSLSAL